MRVGEPPEQLEQQLVELGGRSARARRRAGEHGGERAARLLGQRLELRREPVRREPAQRGDDRRVGQRLAAELDALAVQHEAVRALHLRHQPRLADARLTREQDHGGRRRERVLQLAQRGVTSDQRPVLHTAIISDRAVIWRDPLTSGYARHT